jgi:hypothetical protein
MPTQADPLNDCCWMKDGPIPPVDPADLKSVWAMQEKLKADFDEPTPNRAPNQGFGISLNYYKRVCSPGANVGAVWYRLSILEMLRHISEITGTSLPWPREGKPGDAVFKALATVPMTGLPAGVVRTVPPFDPDELIRLIQKESEA